MARSLAFQRFFTGFLGIAATLGLSVSARADDDTQFELHRTPASFTDVVDAFGEHDAMDVNVRLQFRRQTSTGRIQKELNDEATGDGRDSLAYVDIADHTHIRNILDLGLDIGLHRDLALYARLPVVLSDTRELALPGRQASLVQEDLQVTDPDGQPAQLFSVPFQSPTRSGLDTVTLGIAWSVLNQYRQWHMPTWVVMLESTLGVGEVMSPCFGQAPDASTPRCQGSGSPGMSEGYNELKFETRASKRHRYAEPYTGFSFAARWAGKGKSNYQPNGNLVGYGRTNPPMEGTLTAGVSMFPFEQRDKWQRIVFDARAIGSFVTDGRTYTPLFDALGTSQSDYLSVPNLECVGCTREVPFTGLTDVQAHARIGGRVAVEIQAAKYISFHLGGGLFWDAPHLLSYADACNPDVSVQGGDPRQGTCASGVINPHYRPGIDMPGTRFRMDGQFTYDLFATAMAHF